MPHVVLLGPDHTEYGVVATESPAPGVAVALSRGKYPKGYASVGANEDGALASVEDGSVCLAVADGHNGFQVARIALETVTSTLPQLHTAADGGPDPALRALVGAIGEAIPRHAEDGCALVIALIGTNRISVGSVGDAAAVLIRGRRVRHMAKESPFLTAGSAQGAARITSIRRKADDILILGTDGLFTFLGDHPAEALRRAAEHGVAPAVASDLVASAFAGGAGDNIAVAVALLAR